MSINHLPRQDLALYVLGELEPAPTARLEDHVAACAECAAALAAEAQLELKLQALVPRALQQLPAPQVAARPVPVFIDKAPPRRWPLMAMLAVSLALLIGLSLSRPAPRQPLETRAADEAGLASLSPLSLNEPFTDWPGDPAPLQCGLMGGGLLCAPQMQEPIALAHEAALSSEAFTAESSAVFTPIPATCYAPR